MKLGSLTSSAVISPYSTINQSHANIYKNAFTFKIKDDIHLARKNRSATSNRKIVNKQLK